MAFRRVGSRCLADLHLLGDMTPVIGGDVAGVDAGAFDGIDMPQHVLDLGPAFDLEQDFAAGTHEG